MIENWFALVVIAGAAYHSKENNLQLLMLGTYSIVMLFNFATGGPPDGDSKYWDAYYLGASTVIIVPALMCITLLHDRYSNIYALSLTAQSLISAVMFLDFDVVYFLHEQINANIVFVEIGLAWYAAAKSRTG